MSETKQVADIYFEILDKKYVIEYQCSNVNYERFEERRFLYSTLGIHDIWVFGIENFNLYKKKSGSRKFKAIENNLYSSNKNIYYFNPFKRKFYKVHGRLYKEVWSTKLNEDNFYIDRGEIKLPKEINLMFRVLLDKFLLKVQNEKQKKNDKTYHHNEYPIVKNLQYKAT